MDVFPASRLAAAIARRLFNSWPVTSSVRQGAAALLAVAYLGALAWPAAAAPTRTAPIANIVVALTPDGVWLDGGQKMRCFIARKRGVIDPGVLEVQLRRLRVEGSSEVAISALRRGVTYRELVEVMDVSIKIGLISPQLSTIEDLGVTFDDTAKGRAAAPAQCPSRTTAPPKPSPPAEPPLRHLTRPPSETEISSIEILRAQTPLALPAKQALTNAPVVVITKSEIVFKGQTITLVADIAGGKGVIEPLLTVLDTARSDPADARLIVQADEALDAMVIHRVCATATAAGFNDVLFAVKNRAR